MPDLENFELAACSQASRSPASRLSERRVCWWIDEGLGPAGRDGGTALFGPE